MTAQLSKDARPALVIFLLLTLIVGLLYPWAIGIAAHALFADKASGSPIEVKGQLVGSRLIGQNFTDPGHFWGRPSATVPQPNNGMASGGSNLGPSNPALVDAVRARVKALREADPGNDALVPLDLVTASASGLDPDISPAAARYQVERVARTRGLAPSAVAALVERAIVTRQWGLFGEARVNVLALNLALDHQTGTDLPACPAETCRTPE